MDFRVARLIPKETFIFKSVGFVVLSLFFCTNIVKIGETWRLSECYSIGRIYSVESLRCFTITITATIF